MDIGIIQCFMAEWQNGRERLHLHVLPVIPSLVVAASPRKTYGPLFIQPAGLHHRQAPLDIINEFMNSTLLFKYLYLKYDLLKSDLYARYYLNSITQDHSLLFFHP